MMDAEEIDFLIPTGNPRKGKGHAVPKLKYFPGSASGEQRNVGNLAFLSRHIIPAKHVLQPLVLLLPLHPPFC